MYKLVSHFFLCFIFFFSLSLSLCFKISIQCQSLSLTMHLETVVSWWIFQQKHCQIVRAHLMNLNDIKCNIYSHKAYTWLSQKSKISKYINWWKGRDEPSYFLCSFQSLEQKEQQRAKMRVHPGPTWSDQEQKFSGHRGHTHQQMLWLP